REERLHESEVERLLTWPLRHSQSASQIDPLQIARDLHHLRADPSRTRPRLRIEDPASDVRVQTDDLRFDFPSRFEKRAQFFEGHSELGACSRREDVAVMAHSAPWIDADAHRAPSEDLRMLPEQVDPVERDV